MLLNVGISIRSFYDLQSVRGQLEEGLRARDLSQPLAQIPQKRIADLVGPLYAILGDSTTKPWGIGGTKLSKLLLRKRPSSLALHDKRVRACYVGGDGPIPAAGQRSWSQYMVLIHQAMAEDLQRQAAIFKLLEAHSLAQPPLADLRILDILAWCAAQGPPITP